LLSAIKEGPSLEWLRTGAINLRHMYS